MSSITAQQELINMQNATAQYEAAQETATGEASEMDGDMFLKLMLEQLQYQDPLEPMDNAQFLTQQAQFTQLETSQELNASIATNNSIMQTLALVGKDVTITDPNNESSTITGIVEEAGFNGEDSTITIDGNEYPVSLIQSAREATTETAE